MKRNEQVWRRSRLWILLFFVTLEAMIGLRLWVTTKPSALVGYLTKKDNQYLVVWRDEDSQLQYQTLGSLDGALQFAQQDLKLAAGRNMRPDLELERVWVDDRFGGYVVLWKTEAQPLLHQLTFQNREEATFFAEAFRRGSYAPSPFGHSVLLLPRKE